MTVTASPKRERVASMAKAAGQLDGLQGLFLIADETSVLEKGRLRWSGWMAEENTVHYSKRFMMSERTRITLEELGALLVFLFILVTFACLLAPPRALEDWSNIAAILGTLFVGVGTSLAAAWWFHRRDPLRPRLDIEHTAKVIGEHDGNHLVVVWGKFSNVGEVMIEISNWNVYVSTLLPCPDYLTRWLSDHDHLCSDHQIDWEHVVGRQMLDSELGRLRVRPGETQWMPAYVLIPRSSEVVRVLSAIEDEQLQMRTDESRAWHKADVLDLRKDRAMTTKADQGPNEDKKGDFKRPTPEPGKGSGGEKSQADTLPRLITPTFIVGEGDLKIPVKQEKPGQAVSKGEVDTD